MYKNIDDIKDGTLEGFVYTNELGATEYVTLGSAAVYVRDSCGSEIKIYNKDIPKLIKALQAAYDYKRNEDF